MKVILDAHIHSKYSRATSTDLTLQNLEKYARIKGLSVLGTGDFTHPKWLEELKQNLAEDGSGILKTKTGFPFILQTEISLMYSQGERGRKIHNLVLAPSIEVVEQINAALLKRGRLDYDGRPIFNIPCPEFVELMRSISPEIEVIPAHIWTPWFSLFGSKSGFDSVKECFGDQADHIHALETGLSSDPAMNWRLSALDKYTLISNSDTHSFWPWRIGRECNVFELPKLTYASLLRALKTKEGFVQTIEFWPHEGKYHFDGHRNCGVVMSPEEAEQRHNICPVCKRPLTIGVMHRVIELADREPGFVPVCPVPFRNLIPLSELIAGVLGAGVATLGVWKDYNGLIKAFGDEFRILLDATAEELSKVTSPAIVDIIIKNREQKIEVTPGYDGEYGRPVFGEQKPDLDEKGERQKKQKQTPPKSAQKGLGEFF